MPAGGRKPWLELRDPLCLFLEALSAAVTHPWSPLPEAEGSVCSDVNTGFTPLPTYVRAVPSVTTDQRGLEVGGPSHIHHTQMMLCSQATTVAFHTDAETLVSDRDQFSPSKAASQLLERGNAKALFPPTAMPRCFLSAMVTEATCSQQRTWQQCLLCASLGSSH